MYLPTGKKLVLGSQSPRRASLLEELGLPFRQISGTLEENYDPALRGAAIAEFLAQAKAEALSGQIASDEILLCSDTVVWCEGASLAKAQNPTEARAMLQKLSGRSHRVITALCLWSFSKKVVLSDSCTVHFRTLSNAEIDYYLAHFHPYDKAGAYGIQEWIGMVGIEKIEGSFFTVMGLPTHRLVAELAHW